MHYLHRILRVREEIKRIKSTLTNFHKEKEKIVKELVPKATGTDDHRE